MSWRGADPDIRRRCESHDTLEICSCLCCVTLKDSLDISGSDTPLPRTDIGTLTLQGYCEVEWDRLCVHAFKKVNVLHS